MTARPQRVLTHQQSDAQLHVQLKGLWILSRSVRPTGRMVVRREEGFGGTVLVAGVRWSFRGKDAGSVRIEVDTGATEDAVLGASSAARRHRHCGVKTS
jgi:hypothetical protein